MTARQHSAAHYNALKTATKRLVEALGGIEAAASCTRVGKSQLSDYGNLGSDKFVPADVILDCETVAGAPLLTAALAAAQGYTLTPIARARPGDVAAALISVSRDATRVFTTAAEALADGNLSDAESIALASELDELTTAATRARSLVRPQ